VAETISGLTGRDLAVNPEGRPQRIHQLDAIRGLLAIGVMGYHLLHWPLVLGTWGV